MSKQVELEKLDRAIKDGQIRVNTVQTNIDLLDRDIVALEKVEELLIENVKCLKDKSTIAMASEYKKAKEELAQAKQKLIIRSNEREDFRKALNHVKQSIQESQEAIEKIKKNGENNVLHGNFGKKDNG
jgi:FMN phosphatase YigB (HAD superfamily)